MERIVLADWASLSEWWCVDTDVTEDELAEAVYQHMSAGEIVQVTKEQVSQRLFGGFACKEPNRCHVYHGTGHYTYCHQNSDMTPEERAEVWDTLYENNHDLPFDPSYIYASDVPEYWKVLAQLHQECEGGSDA